MLHPSSHERNYCSHRNTVKEVPLEWGKTNGEKITACKMEGVSKPLSDGGLQIRDLRIQNLSLGEKILWNLVTGKATYCKRDLWKKYFSGTHLRCLNNYLVVRKGSPIYAICLKSIGLPSYIGSLGTRNMSIFGKTP